MDEKTMRALVVEDDPSWQTILSEILTDRGLKVDVTDKLDEAIILMRSASHRLAIVDLSLDGSDHRNRDGLRVLDAVKTYDPGCVTVMLTGYATVELAVDALTAHGAFTCLRKETFTRSAFREMVDEALAAALPWTESGVEGTPVNLDEAVPFDTGEKPEQVRTALVVDDDAGWRAILGELLREAGYETRVCNGLGEALGCLGRERYSLAVVDLSLSGREKAPRSRAMSAPGSAGDEPDGYRLLGLTRASGIPTIVVSGITSPKEIEHTYDEYGIFACLEKQTFDRQAFIRTVGDVASAGQIDGELEQLTERERQVLALLVRGVTNQDIADSLMISINTVKRHLKAIYKKLEVSTRSAAVAKALNAGLSTGAGPLLSSMED
ncbi:MAG: response regulator [Anaerolineae bacterium]|nr:response regulator [Anaerolineae bacterium]